jgi:DNA primase
METPAMTTMLALRAAPLLLTTMLIAAPAWAQTAPSTTPDTTSSTPSGTSQKAAPHTSPAASAKQSGQSVEALVERRIADLQSRLHITPEQSQQWDRFAEMMRDNAKGVDELYQQRAEKMNSMSAVDNMQSYAQIEQQRAQDVQKLVPAFQTLYDSLSDQQKKLADQTFRNYAAHAQARHQAAAHRG